MVLFLSYQECNSRGFPSMQGFAAWRGRVRRLSPSLSPPPHLSLPLSLSPFLIQKFRLNDLKTFKMFILPSASFWYQVTLYLLNA